MAQMNNSSSSNPTPSQIANNKHGEQAYRNKNVLNSSKICKFNKKI